MKTDPQLRFWCKVAQEGSCLVWMAGKDRKGYGKFSLDGKLCMAHRVAWEWVKGPIPEGHQLDHLCKNRACVKWEHLEAVLPVENNRRSDSVSARNIGKTHCPKGHEFTEANTVIQMRRGRPMRKCRTCTQEFDRKRKYQEYHCGEKL